MPFFNLFAELDEHKLGVSYKFILEFSRLTLTLKYYPISLLPLYMRAEGYNPSPNNAIL